MFALARVQVLVATLSGRGPGTVVTVAEKTKEGGRGRWLAQVRGVRGRLGAGPRGLTVVVAVTAGGNRSMMITDVLRGRRASSPSRAMRRDW